MAGDDGNWTTGIARKAVAMLSFMVHSHLYLRRRDVSGQANKKDKVSREESPILPPSCSLAVEEGVGAPAHASWERSHVDLFT